MLYIRLVILSLFMYIFATQTQAEPPCVPGFQLVIKPMMVEERIVINPTPILVVDPLYDPYYIYGYTYFPIYRPLLIPTYYQSYRYIPKPYYPPIQHLQPPRPMPQKHR